MDSSEPLFLRPCSLALLQSGGGKAPQQSSKSKQAEALQLKLMQAQLKASQKPLEMPAMPTMVSEPAPIPPPPPTQTSSDVINAEQEARRQTGRKRGIQSTMLTVPKSNPNPYALGGMQSLLG